MRKYASEQVRKYLRKCTTSLLEEVEILNATLQNLNNEQETSIQCCLNVRPESHNIQPTESQVNVFTGPSECASI